MLSLKCWDDNDLGNAGHFSFTIDSLARSRGVVVRNYNDCSYQPVMALSHQECANFQRLIGNGHSSKLVSLRLD